MTRVLKSSSVHLTFRIGSQDGVKALVPGVLQRFQTWTLHLQISAAAALSPSPRAPLRSKPFAVGGKMSNPSILYS